MPEATWHCLYGWTTGLCADDCCVGACPHGKYLTDEEWEAYCKAVDEECREAGG